MLNSAVIGAVVYDTGGDYFCNRRTDNKLQHQVTPHYIPAAVVSQQSHHTRFASHCRKSSIELDRDFVAGSTGNATDQLYVSRRLVCFCKMMAAGISSAPILLGAGAFFVCNGS